MTNLPFITDSANAVPIHAIRAADWKGWIERHSETLRRLATALDFQAQNARIMLAPATDGSIERVLFGVGDKANVNVMGALAQHLPAGDYRIAFAPREFDATSIAVAWGLGAYAFDRYKKRKRPAPRLVAPEGADMEEAGRIVEASWLARDLVNTPTNDMGPEALHAAAEKVARECGAEFEAIVGDELLTQNYPLLHAVGRAAAEAPRLLHLSWGADDAPRVALVGKGITFDTGGLDIKPAAGMRMMKKDMGGAAHALALGQLVMQSKLNVRLDVFLAVAENSISANAFRPGDVIASRKGLTVEIDNTDAEGRLVLADALTRACEDGPALLLDFATLTGAARTALGPDIPPFYTGDEALAAEFTAASLAATDPIWRMPLWDAYEGDMDTPIADLKNTGDGAMAGSIYGALFLRRFVTVPAWAHFDIFAWAPKEKPGRPQGGEAQALRASYRVIKARFG
ncbi:leucyl aminopeptidase family protein [Terricaulis sp.]|uniref:leucyl aminopeptidase family protein n=1 Tax=Terricaulis sp. TaxID=2768686 RepID=UPI002AC74CD5|nr:leucyl aminopeptidase family protein [Terricaulis sp.]MDZ4692720.1 leucyl aminopeptidase family protein [Terricaulis sp.]